MTYHDGLPPKNLHEPLNMWSHEVTWQIKNIIHPLSQCLWLPNLTTWSYTAMGSHSLVPITPQWVGLVRPCYKLNELYLYLQNIHGRQTRQDSDLTWDAPTLKVTLLFDYVTKVKSPDHLKNQFSIFTRLMGTKLGGVLI